MTNVKKLSIYLINFILFLKMIISPYIIIFKIGIFSRYSCTLGSGSETKQIKK